MGQEQEIQQGLEVGATEYVLKPFAPDVLMAKVREILERTGKD
jgi:DNA-binding response OmpR family regulator